MEILRQHPQPIDAVFCCVGGGGLIAGGRLHLALRPETKIIGVEAMDADAMDRSAEGGPACARRSKWVFLPMARR